MQLTLFELKILAAKITRIAEAELMPRFERSKGTLKADGSLVTEADLAMQEAVSLHLREQWPQIPLLAEEMSQAEQEAQLATHSEGLWCLDPLDGTSNFAHGLPFFAVSLALIVNGEVECGIVYDPCRKECFCAMRGQGAWLNDKPLKTEEHASDQLGDCLALVDFKRLPAALASQLAAYPPYRSQRSLGSVALDWCWLAAQRVGIYLHGKQYPWDFAAGLCILGEAGGQAKTLEGDSPRLRHLGGTSIMAAANDRLFQQWRQHLERINTAQPRLGAASS